MNQEDSSFDYSNEDYSTITVLGMEVCGDALERMKVFNVPVELLSYVNVSEACVYGFLRKMWEINKDMNPPFFKRHGYFMCPLKEIETRIRLSKGTVMRCIKTLKELTDLEVSRVDGNNYAFKFKKQKPV